MDSEKQIERDQSRDLAARRRLRAWKNAGCGVPVATMLREAADGGTPLRIPIIIQRRTRSAGTVYRWKEQYDFGAGDSSEEFTDRATCVADAERHAVDEGMEL